MKLSHCPIPIIEHWTLHSALQRLTASYSYSIDIDKAPNIIGACVLFVGLVCYDICRFALQVFTYPVNSIQCYTGTICANTIQCCPAYDFIPCQAVNTFTMALHIYAQRIECNNNITPYHLDI